MKIRYYTLKDMNSVSEMLNANALDRMMYGSRGYVVEELEDMYWKPKYVLVDDDGIIIGILCLEFYSQGDYANVNGIFISPEYRGKGMAQALIEYAKKASREFGMKHIEAIIFDCNEKSISAFHKAGFKEQGYKKFGVFYRRKWYSKKYFYFDLEENGKEPEIEGD